VPGLLLLTQQKPKKHKSESQNNKHHAEKNIPNNTLAPCQGAVHEHVAITIHCFKSETVAFPNPDAPPYTGRLSRSSRLSSLLVAFHLSRAVRYVTDIRSPTFEIEGSTGLDHNAVAVARWRAHVHVQDILIAPHASIIGLTSLLRLLTLRTLDRHRRRRRSGWSWRRWRCWRWRWRGSRRR